MTPATAQPVVDTGIAAFKSGDYKKALDTLERPALNGNAEAQYLMGQMREQGLGISSDHKRALYWYGRAAAQGHVGARAAQEAMGGIASLAGNNETMSRSTAPPPSTSTLSRAFTSAPCAFNFTVRDVQLLARFFSDADANTVPLVETNSMCNVGLPLMERT